MDGGGTLGRDEKKLHGATGIGTVKRLKKCRVWGGKDDRIGIDRERECQ
jgi:hypothetical protein